MFLSKMFDSCWTAHQEVIFHDADVAFALADVHPSDLQVRLIQQIQLDVIGPVGVWREEGLDQEKTTRPNVFCHRGDGAMEILARIRESNGTEQAADDV